MGMIPQQGEVTTEMPDLLGYSLSDLRAHQGQALADAVQLVLRQVERPRFNLGGSAPPGRAD
jgi:hypothetical protein